ncbi:MAG: prepilin-type N-terminal cleavage/methylation domain-containing protein [Leptolyngbya sp. RL_3_1]|nr:prepilin-type N-terminal cleavage/methylation domain-containing protein [Leptolyngbya sp. RL_3_1]
MKTPSTRYWLGRLLLRAQKFKTAGFTLLELLVAMLIGSIIISTLLYLVLEMLQIERRETAVDNTQRDMQRALEYMSSDVREAVHVYSTPATLPAVTQLVAVGALPGPASTTVLAFWRPDPVEDDDIPNVCSTTFSGNADAIEECNVFAGAEIGLYPSGLSALDQ